MGVVPDLLDLPLGDGLGVTQVGGDGRLRPAGGEPAHGERRGDNGGGESASTLHGQHSLTRIVIYVAPPCITLTAGRTTAPPPAK
ncbi:hypothetical protein GCM10025331_02640 [Actinoplanes utahensis]|nr:hypothetical protein Aut01nite_09930 [Actinoplanes utahensis]